MHPMACMFSHKCSSGKFSEVDHPGVSAYLIMPKYSVKRKVFCQYNLVCFFIRVGLPDKLTEIDFIMVELISS